MVTKRENIEYYGLKISIEPAEEKPFYLTGDTPLFNVIIENQTSKKRRGKILIRWRLGGVLDGALEPRIVRFELNPLERKKYELPREWLYREGIGIYELVILPKAPDYYAEHSDNEVRGLGFDMSYGVHPLCSYYVKDRGIYNYEKYYRITIIIFSLITIVLTILNVFLTH